MSPTALDIIKVLAPATAAFAIGIIMTPFWAGFLYRAKMWKSSSVKLTTDGQAATITASLHKDEERKTPRMGGVIIWGSVTITSLLFLTLPYLAPGQIFEKLSFVSRNQTWIPLLTLLAGALCGLLDDYLVCRDRGTYKGGGLSLSVRLSFVGLLGLVIGWWFYAMLGHNAIHIPFWGELELGLLFIPLFIVMMIGIYSGGIIDGVDGLSGGVFASIFASYAIIAFVQDQIDLAAFASAIAGGTLAFLWFNIPPARFFNSETGTMSLTTSLVVLAFLAKQVVVLPVIALLLVATSASALIQILSKRLRGGKKVFIVAPLHNHFQAKGWPFYKVTMRYWVLSVIFGTIGVIIALLG